MVNEGIAKLAGETDVQAGWNSLFTAHNAEHGAEGGYQAGQKIAIKVNMNDAGAYGDDTKGETRESDTNPVLLRTLLLSLVEEAGVSPEMITVYDAGRIIPDYVQKLCGQGILTGVQFQYRALLGEHDARPDLDAPVVWSQDVSGETNYLPACVTDADYLINLANLKGHVYGITLTEKNHYGSILNSNRMRAPFNSDYTSSVFLSQDPVALDSVGADFLMNEPAVTNRNRALKDNPNVENYLHEAGLVANAPSGTVYLNGNGEALKNLGAHEHWNNAADKQYSRNL